MGCKSPVRERSHAGFHNGRQHDASTRPKQLRDREVPWEGSHRSKLMSSAAGDAERQQVCGRPAQAGGQPPEESSGVTVRMCLSRISDTPGKNRVDGKGPATVQGTDTGNHQPQPGCFDLLYAAGTTAIRGGLDELFRSQPGLSCYPGVGPVGATACADVLLEAVETGAHAAAAAHPVGYPSGGGVQSHSQSPGLLVDGRDEHCSASAGQSLAGGTGSAESKGTMGADALRQAESAVQSCRR